MPDVLVHAGFYKTGTTSLQAVLRANRERLKPFVTLCLQEDLGRAKDAPRRWAEAGGYWRLLDFRLALRAALRRLPDAGRLIISREAFCGAMLGTPRARRPVLSYAPAAVPLARIVAAEIARRFPHGLRLRFVYTTREQRALLASLWGHHVRAGRMVEGQRDFVERHRHHFDQAAELDAIRAALAPVPVLDVPLERVAPRPLGPAEALFDLIGLPDRQRRELVPAPVANAAPGDAVMADLLRLNAEISDPVQARAAKRRRRGVPPPDTGG